MMENIPYTTRDSLGTRGQCPNERIRTPTQTLLITSPMTFAQVGDVDVDVEVELDTLLRTFAVV